MIEQHRRNRIGIATRSGSRTPGIFNATEWERGDRCGRLSSFVLSSFITGSSDQ
jgi:hypothetical protein